MVFVGRNTMNTKATALARRAHSKGHEHLSALACYPWLVQTFLGKWAESMLAQRVCQASDRGLLQGNAVDQVMRLGIDRYLRR